MASSVVGAVGFSMWICLPAAIAYARVLVDRQSPRSP
jgi:hypothetical protein